MTAFDVGVIGAGIHGASAAFHLSTAGARVAIVDPRGAAGGPTGRSSAICRAYYTNPFLAACARDSIEMFERFEELTGADAGLVRTGLLYLHPANDEAATRASAERLNALGIAVDVLEGDRLADAASGFDLDGVAIAAYERGAGYADPHATTDGLFRRAVELGATAFLGRRVIELRPLASGAELALDDGDRLACGRVLIAAGPWTRPLAAMAGADLPLTVERHIVATFRWAGVEPAPAHSDLVAGYYLRPEGSDLFLVGPTHASASVDPDAFDDAIRPGEVDELARRVSARVPRLERSEVHGGWASLYDMSPDWQPVIGEIASEMFVDAGTSGHGFKLAPALGRHVAAMVLGERTDPDLAAFDPFRFEVGRALAAGYGENRILG
jgi:sarcosine oxidase, subunit beta